MSASRELQKMIYDRLVADTTIHAIVGDRIYDARPSDGAFPCITFGPSDYQTEDYDCIDARREAVQIDCWSDDQGRLGPCKDLTDAVKVSLHRFAGAMATHALVLMEVSAVRVFLDADGVKGHGVVTVEAEIEER